MEAQRRRPASAGSVPTLVPPNSGPVLQSTFNPFKSVVVPQTHGTSIGPTRALPGPSRPPPEPRPTQEMVFRLPRESDLHEPNPQAPLEQEQVDTGHCNVGHLVAELSRLRREQSELYLERDGLCAAREAAEARIHVTSDAWKREHKSQQARISELDEQRSAAEGRAANAEATVSRLNRAISVQRGSLADMRRRAVEAEAARDLAEAKAAELIERECCCICLDKPRSVVLQPCLHFALCGSCAAGVSRCPICRAHIDRRDTVIAA